MLHPCSFSLSDGSVMSRQWSRKQMKQVILIICIPCSFPLFHVSVLFHGQSRKLVKQIILIIRNSLVTSWYRFLKNEPFLIIGALGSRNVWISFFVFATLYLCLNGFYCLVANRVTEVNEMWRIREKELELNGQLKGSDGTSGRHRSPDHGHQKCHSADCCSTSSRTDRKRLVNNTDDPCVLNSLVCSSGFSPEHDGALKDEELEDFLRSRLLLFSSKHLLTNYFMIVLRSDWKNMRVTGPSGEEVQWVQEWMNLAPIFHLYHLMKNQYLHIQG